jgi:hypothetical protein
MRFSTKTAVNRYISIIIYARRDNFAYYMGSISLLKAASVLRNPAKLH